MAKKRKARIDLYVNFNTARIDFELPKDTNIFVTIYQITIENPSSISLDITNLFGRGITVTLMKSRTDLAYFQLCVESRKLICRVSDYEIIELLNIEKTQFPIEMHVIS